MRQAVSVKQEAMEEDIMDEIVDLDQEDQGESSLPQVVTSTLLGWQRSSKSRRYLRWMCRIGIPVLLLVLFSLNNGFSLPINRSLVSQKNPAHLYRFEYHGVTYTFDTSTGEITITSIKFSLSLFPGEKGYTKLLNQYYQALYQANSPSSDPFVGHKDDPAER